MIRASIHFRVAALIAVGFCFGSIQAQNKIVRPHPSSTLSFVKNMGQWQEPFLYKTDVPYGTVFLEQNGITYNFISPESREALHNQMHHYFLADVDTEVIAQFHSFKMQFKNANDKINIKEEEKQETYHNYYHGNNPARWKSKVPLYNKLVYSNVYPDIDYEIFSSGNVLKYNFIINPKGDAKQIKMHYEGCELRIEDGKLKIKTSVNELIEAEPYAYQLINDKIVIVPCMFVLNGSDVSFQTASFNRDEPLIIDPIILFATYSGSAVDNFGFSAAFDSKGNLYSAGICGVEDTTGNGYPTTIGSFQKKYQGGSARIAFYGVDNRAGWDISISKYNPTGTTLLYATYLGGSDNEYPNSLLVDYNDNLVVLGTTFSSDFPHSLNAFDTTLNDGKVKGKTDIILTKFDLNGSFLASTFIGGNKFDGVSTTFIAGTGYRNSNLVYNYADEFRGDIIADRDNNYYIGSVTESADFPTKNPIQNTLNGPFDGVVFKIDSNLSKLDWSTYIGGSAEDAIYSIDLNKDNTVYICGGTMSNDFPNTADGYQKNYAGETDGFIARMDNNGKKILSATYIGTDKYDQTYFIELDKKGNVFATGQTEGSFPVTSGKYSNAKGSQYIIKLDSTLGNKDFSTVFGTGRSNPNSNPSNPDISPTAFLVDNCNLIYVSGWGSTLGPGFGHGGTTKGLPLVYTPFKPAYDTTDGNDFYLIVFEPNCAGVRYTTFIGGNQSEDHVDGGTSRFDKRGIIYEAVCASCGGYDDFPTQPPTVKFKHNISGECSNAAFKLDFQLQTAIVADFRPSPRIGCIPQTILMNSTSKAVHYYWDFDEDGITDDTTQSPQHTYTKAGTYKIRLVCEDTNTCNRFDTLFDQVTLLDNSKAAFSYEVSFCDNTVTLKNESQNRITFVWDFGDGTMDSTTENPSHKYTVNGKYDIKLSINQGFACSDSAIKTIDFEQFKPTPPIIPNVFTPNGDGRNDFFEIGGINPKCDKFDMKVYNRWGQLLFETKDVGNWWAGNFKNHPLPEGVYYYSLEVTDYKGTVTKRKGDVTIIR